VLGDLHTFSAGIALLGRKDRVVAPKRLHKLAGGLNHWRGERESVQKGVVSKGTKVTRIGLGYVTVVQGDKMKALAGKHGKTEYSKFRYGTVLCKLLIQRN